MSPKNKVEQQERSRSRSKSRSPTRASKNKSNSDSKSKSKSKSRSRSRSPVVAKKKRGAPRKNPESKKETVRATSPSRKSDRSRKVVARFDPPPPPVKKEIVVSAGAGVALGDIPHIRHEIDVRNSNKDLLEKLHLVLLGRGKKREIKIHLRQFSGLVFSDADEKEVVTEKIRGRLQRWTVAELRDLCRFLAIGNRQRPKDELLETALDFLLEPKELIPEKKVGQKRPRPSKSEDGEEDDDQEEIKEDDDEEDAEEKKDSDDVEEILEEDEEEEVKPPPKKRAKKDPKTKKKKKKKKKTVKKAKTPKKKADRKKKSSKKEDEEEIIEEEEDDNNDNEDTVQEDEPKPKATKTRGKAKPKSDAEPKTKSKSDTKTKAKPKTKGETETKTKTKTKGRGKAKPKKDTKDHIKSTLEKYLQEEQNDEITMAMLTAALKKGGISAEFISENTDFIKKAAHEIVENQP